MEPDKTNDDKRLGIKELIEGIGVLVAILVAGTSLLSNSGNLPSWWFDFSLVFLIVLTFIVPTVIFWGSISKRLGKFNLNRKKDAVARKYFTEFEDLLENFRRTTDLLPRILDSLRSEFDPKLKEKMGLLPSYLLQEYGRNDLTHPLYNLNKGFESSNRSFRELCLLLDEFEIVIYSVRRLLRIIFIFVEEMKKEYSIPDGVEREFEDFREKYNAFLRDFKKYAKKGNKEIGELAFPEFVGEFIKKW